MTWTRADRVVRLFMNGEMKLNHTVSDNPNLNFKNSGHAVYDIGFKRDSRTTTHASLSDLMVFSREFQFSPPPVFLLQPQLVTWPEIRTHDLSFCS